jgi:hypothetical protein
MRELGRLFFVIGIVFIIVGVVFWTKVRIPFLGKLPGDIVIKKENYTFYFPVVTCLLISLIITLIFWLLGKR